MSTERIIGIDFGTSTSVMRVKRYRENGQSVDDRLYTAEVKFGNSSLVPTLIREMQSGEPYYGYDAQKEHKKSTLLDNFKVELESPDPQKREQARALTEEFFAYLAKQYRDQSQGGFFGEADETEKTLVSYPVKWSDETRKFMLEAAKKAGFKNVEGMDEAQAAITAVMVQSTDYLSQRGYLRDGVPANVLMADMGAGTTDLVLCRYTPGESAKYEILSAWPKDGSTLFGGREVESMLQDYLRSKLPEEDADMVMKRCSLSKFKSWKEDYVSLALSRNETVMEFTEFDERIEDLEIDIEEYAIDRNEFETIAADYLKGFPMLVNGCLKEAELSGDEVDLVLLTGGHSQWYFVKEQLCGRLDRFGAIGLGKMKADPERIIPVPRPQETVALGLVYSPLAKEVRFAGKEEPKPEPEPAEQPEEERQTRQVEARVEVKPSPQPVHKEKQENTKSTFWDESKRVLPLTPEGEFEFREVGGAYEVKMDNEDNKYIYDVPNGYEVVRYLGDREVVSIPSQYRGRPVVAVGESAFDKYKKNALELKQVEIPGSCRIVGGYAFRNELWDEETSLNKVILHPGMQIIGSYAFGFNIQLSSLGFPDGLLEIGAYAFQSCDLEKVYIPASCKHIWDFSFSDTDLSAVIFPLDAQIERIDEMAFEDTWVERIKLPRSCGCSKLIRRRGKKGTFLGLRDEPDEWITIERY